MLDLPHRAWRQAYDVDFDEEESRQMVGRGLFNVSPEKPPLFSFDFLEVCGGAGVVGEEMARLGFVVGPNLDISFSPFYDIRSLRLMEWLLFMMSEKRLGSLMLEPVCTTFSPAAHPACRSYQVPEGFDQSLEKVEHGNMIAYRCLFLLWFARILALPALLENPRLSKMAWLRQWRWLVSTGCIESIVASCAFGSIHKKEFRILSTGVEHERLEIRCPGGHRHVPIAGAYTKKSAIYVPGVARHFALALGEALRKKKFAAEAEDAGGHGEESLLVNDLLRAKGWSLVRAWFWKRKAHINVYESAVVVSIQKQLLLESPSVRFNVVVDSLVSKGALAKGRSSALTLSPVLKQSSAVQIAGCLYPSYSYGPSKLNVSDDPSRGVPIREGSRFDLLKFLSPADLRGVELTGLRRFQANWIRLVALLVCVRGSAAEEIFWIQPDQFDGFQPMPHIGFALSCLASSWILLFTICFGLWIFSALDFLREVSSVPDSVLSRHSCPSFRGRSVVSGFPIPLSHGFARCFSPWS